MSHDIYSAFGNTVRVRLLLCLADKPKTVTELISTCGLSQSAVSQHLAKLRSTGLVSSVRNRKTVVYTLAYKQAAAICKLLISLQQEIP